MKEIIITTQEQLNKITRIEKDERVIIKNALRLNGILEVHGYLRVEMPLDCFYSDGRLIEARGNSSVVAWENSSVVAWGNSSVEAWENSVIRAISDATKVVLHGFSVCFLKVDLKLKIDVQSKNAVVQKISDLDWFENNAVKKTKKIIIYKKVSHDFKTQERTKNETLWTIGSTIEHPSWKPETGECGEGKYHACSRPYFCDEFRNEKNDRYIAIEIKLEDMYEWKDNPFYPHKIGFRACKVLFECNRFGKQK